MNKKYLAFTIASLFFASNSNGESKLSKRAQEKRNTTKKVLAVLTFAKAIENGRGTDEDDMASNMMLAIPSAICATLPFLKEEPFLQEKTMVLENQWVDGIGEFACQTFMNSLIMKATHKVIGTDSGKNILKTSMVKWTQKHNLGQAAALTTGTITGTEGWNWIKTQLVKNGWCKEASDEDKSYNPGDIRFSYNTQVKPKSVRY
jgi:hypothetical protein